MAVMLKEKEGRDVIRLHVTEAIATYVSLLPAGRGVSTGTIITMGDYFTDHPLLRQLTPDELKTFFQFAFRQQKYGKLYAGFGYDTLLEWLEAFFDERCEMSGQVNEQRHTQYTASEKRGRYRSEGDALAKSINQITDETNQTEGTAE